MKQNEIYSLVGPPLPLLSTKDVIRMPRSPGPSLSVLHIVGNQNPEQEKTWEWLLTSLPGAITQSILVLFCEAVITTLLTLGWDILNVAFMFVEFQVHVYSTISVT